MNEQENKRKINNEVLVALMNSNVLINEAQAKYIIKMIVSGEIPHVSIKY